MLGIICATETASEILFGGMIINLILISGHHICNSQQDVARLGSAGKRFKQVIDLLAHASKWRGAAPHGHLGPGTIVVEKQVLCFKIFRNSSLFFIWLAIKLQLPVPHKLSFSARAPVKDPSIKTEVWF